MIGLSNKVSNRMDINSTGKVTRVSTLSMSFISQDFMTPPTNLVRPEHKFEEESSR